jgi:hypothetical protein
MHSVEEGQKKTNRLLQELVKASAATAKVEKPVRSSEDRLKSASSITATINQGRDSPIFKNYF